MSCSSCSCGEAEGCLSVCCPCYIQGQIRTHRAEIHVNDIKIAQSVSKTLNQDSHGPLLVCRAQETLIQVPMLTSFTSAGTGCTQSCACAGACANSEHIVDVRPEPDSHTEYVYDHDAPPEGGHALEGQDAVSQLTGQRQLPTPIWQTGFQQADRLEDAPTVVSSCSHIVRGCPVFHSTIIQASPVQPAIFRAAHQPPDAIMGRAEERTQSNPPPQAGTQALQAAHAVTAELPLSGSIPLPALCTHMAADPLQQTGDESGLHPRASQVPQQQDMHSGFGVSVPVGGGQISPAHGTPDLDLLDSINWLTQQQQVPLSPGALASSLSALTPSAGRPGPPSMLSAAGMAPSTPQL